MPSLIFGKYEIIRRLAVGGMGEIFLARQSGVAGFDRLVILKSLLPDLSARASFVDQFLNEARVAANLNHPNIVSIYEVGLWEGTYFIAMEYINGENVAALLHTVVRRQLGFPLSIAAHIARAAALGLDHAHHAPDTLGSPLSIVHRDISPQNIMVRVDGVTKVVDFGIAKASNRSSHTAAGVVKGKVRYMSPEQLRGEVVDARTDQFSLGMVLWEMLTQKRFFKKTSGELEVLAALTTEPIPPPSSRNPAVPPDLDRIVLRMMNRDREQRFPRCYDAAEELRSLLDERPERVDLPQVAEFIQRAIGEEVKSRISDLTPSRENFVISFQNRKTADMEIPIELSVDEAGMFDEYGTDQRPASSGLEPTRREVGARSNTGSRSDGFALEPPANNKAAVGAVAILTAVVLGVFGFSQLNRIQADDSASNAAAATQAARPDAGIDSAATLPAPPQTHGEHDPKKVGPEPCELVVQSQPKGATVRAGSLLFGSTPLTITTLPPGVELLLMVEKDGYVPQELSVRLTSGQKTEREIKLAKRTKAPSRAQGPVATPTPAAPRAPLQDGFLTIKTTPWTKVAIDGAPIGSTPIFRVKLTPGKHWLHLVNEQAGVDTKRMVEIAPGATEKLDLKLGG